MLSNAVGHGKQSPSTSARRAMIRCWLFPLPIMARACPWRREQSIRKILSRSAHAPGRARPGTFDRASIGGSALGRNRRAKSRGRRRAFFHSSSPRRADATALGSDRVTPFPSSPDRQLAHPPDPHTCPPSRSRSSSMTKCRFAVCYALFWNRLTIRCMRPKPARKAWLSPPTARCYPARSRTSRSRWRECAAAFARMESGAGHRSFGARR